jgi:hypothetical protein
MHASLLAMWHVVSNVEALPFWVIWMVGQPLRMRAGGDRLTEKKFC